MTQFPREVCFSIITVTRNAARHIGACLDSVAAQTHLKIEHLVIDGASTDGTQDIVAHQIRRPAFLVSEPDCGIYSAMNKGLARATGDYILFLGADDFLFDKAVLADVAAFLTAQGFPDVIYGDIETRAPSGRRGIYRAPRPADALDVMICGCLPHQATFAHRRVFFDRVGLFDTRYRVQADYDWFLRVLGAEGLEIRHMDRIIASFALDGASSQLQRGQGETYAIQNAFPLYRQPEWIERRLFAFQRELLAHRVQLQSATQSSLLHKIARKLASDIPKHWIRRIHRQS